jgi:hypothetical protein
VQGVVGARRAWAFEYKARSTGMHLNAIISLLIGRAAAVQAHASIAPFSTGKAQHSGWSPSGEQQSPSGDNPTLKDRQNLSFVSVDELPLSTDT